MPCAFTEIEPPTVKMSVDCIAFTANRGWRNDWMSCQLAPLSTRSVFVSASSDMRLNAVMSSTTAPRAKACPPMLWRTPAIEVFRPLAFANASARRTSSSLGDADHAMDGRATQATGVVDRAAALQPRHVGRVPARERRGPARFVIGRDRRAVLRPFRIGGKLHRHAHREEQQDGRHQQRAKPAAKPAPWPACQIGRPGFSSHRRARP